MSEPYRCRRIDLPVVELWIEDHLHILTPELRLVISARQRIYCFVAQFFIRWDHPEVFHNVCSHEHLGLSQNQISSHVNERMGEGTASTRYCCGVNWPRAIVVEHGLSVVILAWNSIQDYSIKTNLKECSW